MKEIKYNILDKVNYPCDLKNLSINDLKILADEVRSKTIDAVSVTGGHLGAGLGVVELSVALHYVFDTPKDKLIWDVGHQTYPHKILTGRKDKIHTLRQEGGLSGFTKISESEYDAFGAGHSSTSISAALGMAVARDLSGENYEVVPIIGDGALSAGMAYEAMNNAGAMDSKLIVVLNDNEMSISPPVGAMSKYLSRLITSKSYTSFRNIAKNVASHLPYPIEKAAKMAEKYAKDVVCEKKGHAKSGNIFEDMGFYYVGPLDGHDLEQMVPIFKNIKNDKNIKKPILIHVITEKGRGFEIENAASKEKLHSVSKFNRGTRIQEKKPKKARTYTDIFASSLMELAKKDEKIVAISAAMLSGTGLDKFIEEYPDRCFDVGISEQHAVTFAAGLAVQGFKPYCAIYSTFLQRAYDQIVHDVAIQSLPVKFAIDRAGLVGADGATHAGAFDIAYLASLPNFVVMAASDEASLASIILTANNINDRPCAFRYPRGEGVGVKIPNPVKALEIGKSKIVCEGSDVAILSFGTRLSECKKAADVLKSKDISVTLVDAIFAKPLDGDLIEKLAKSHKVLITIEEGSIGGFAAHVMDFLADKNLLNNGLKVKSLFLPDAFLDHGSMENIYKIAGLDADSIVKSCEMLLT